MKVFQCDRCKEVIGTKYRYYISMTDWVPQGNHEDYDYHLCDKCGDEFKKFIGQEIPTRLVKDRKDLESKDILECNNCVHKDCCNFFNNDSYCYLELLIE